MKTKTTKVMNPEVLENPTTSREMKVMMRMIRGRVSRGRIMKRRILMARMRILRKRINETEDKCESRENQRFYILI